ncbi:MAG: hypothetical protein JRH20_03430 [Deltaproteobacteria bacterium]|nr:hypothetical protein [Deltaproteobacteria bacterium]
MASALKSRIEDLKLSMARLSTRERAMVGSLVAVFGFLVILGTGYLIYSSVEDAEQRNIAMRKALRDINLYRDKYVAYERRIKALERAIPTTALDLNSFVEEAAAAVGVKIDESSEVPPASAGRYTKRGMEIKVRKVSLGELAAFLKQMEELRTHVVQVTELSIHTRWQRHKEVDAELTIITYERSKKKASTKKKAGRG